CMQSLDFPLSF
nr:immunoglobulin light chain junction region [Macaca mulatta]MOX85422.1 immunoglobulin light chain junction region [Macaca mulatta]MOX88542.1 immunoglobulin light chain junction region [Macaca mulatta]MOX89149.1 immunoglobulin light chain junction region [Macaca mulatta]